MQPFGVALTPTLLLLLLATCAVGQDAGANSTRRSKPQQYPSYDGTKHNPDQPNWGRTHTPYIRKQVPETAYSTGGAGGGGETLAGANRPSPRAVTLALLSKPYFKATSHTNTSYLLTALGQLVSHDITRGLSNSSSNGGPAPIKVPPGDPLFWRFTNQTPVLQGARTTLPYIRTNYTRLKPGGPREQVNDASAWLDAAILYGESAKMAKIVRAGTAGRLLSDDERKLLPLNVDKGTGEPKYKMKNPAERLPQTQLRLCGNTNINQNPMLMSITTVLMREHNRRARLIEAADPDADDEEIFNEARKWVIGHFQQIALGDYLRGLGIVLPPYKGFNSSLNPAIDNFFSTVAYRYGHSTINDIILRLDESWDTDPKGHLSMRQAMYNPTVAMEAGIEPLIRGLLVQPQGRVEPRWVTSISGNWLGDGAINGTDLSAINIQRGRDHGIPDYNSCRRALGLRPFKTFDEITPDKEIAAIMKELYGNVDNIDAYVGGLAEPRDGASHLGPLFTASLKEQFSRIRDADWWYYENGAKNGLYNESEIEEIRNTNLRAILARNTNIRDLPDDLWTAASVCGAGDSAGTDGSGSGGGDGSRQFVQPNLLSRSASLTVSPSDTDGWVKVLLTSTGAGWLGFGVADPDSGSAMIGADLVVGRMENGAPQVSRYKPTDHQPPPQVPDADRLKNVKFQQSNDRVVLSFERPMNGDDGRAMSETDRMRIVVARGPNNDIKSFSGYHGPNKHIIDLPRGLYGGEATGAAPTSKAVTQRKAHGLLMAINFIVIFPLGALAARQLRSHWLRSPAVRASLFYVHIATQVCGTACVTAGFVLATKEFKVPYQQVEWSHGKLGIAILVLVYSQLLLGFVRPTASAPTGRRQAWDMVHSIFGRAAMLVGLANIALGITIFTTRYGGHLGLWVGLCGFGLGAITLLQHILDRQEKYAVLKNDQELVMLAADGKSEVSGRGKSFGAGSQQIRSRPSVDAAAEAQGDFGAFGSPTAAAPAGIITTGAAAAGGAAAGAGAAGAGALAAGAGGGGAGGAARSPKLTANLLQKHEASSNGGSQDVGIGHPDFSPQGLPHNDHHHMGHTAWDQGTPTMPRGPTTGLPGSPSAGPAAGAGGAGVLGNNFASGNHQQAAPGLNGAAGAGAGAGAGGVGGGSWHNPGSGMGGAGGLPPAAGDDEQPRSRSFGFVRH